MSTTRSEKILRVAAVLALIGLAFVAWSIVDPRPAPILLGLSVGQGFGILSFLLFALVVAADLGLKRHIKHEGVDAEPGGESAKEPPAG